ncbi:hypothetical protein M0802_004681 [Mischocyttarus mexicanus]|nr:hypothetical protein M0802_004681 [Mischocyttarus mexicanus]
MIKLNGINIEISNNILLPRSEVIKSGLTNNLAFNFNSLLAFLEIGELDNYVVSDTILGRRNLIVQRHIIGLD